MNILGFWWLWLLVAEHPPLPKHFPYLDTKERSNLSYLRAAHEPKQSESLSWAAKYLGQKHRVGPAANAAPAGAPERQGDRCHCQGGHGCKSSNAPPEAADMVPPVAASPAPRALLLCLSRTILFPNSRQPGQPRSSSQPATVEPNFTYNEAVPRKTPSYQCKPGWLTWSHTRTPFSDF